MIPPLSLAGHLPPGRHPASLAEVESRFVSHPEFVKSTSRADVWEGFLTYLSMWSAAEEQVDSEILRAVWVAGSFISSNLNPSDIDISPLYDETALQAASGKPGIKGLKRLFRNRSSIVTQFKVEPFAVPWRGIPSTLLPGRLNPAERESLAVRGGVDAWWGRTRPNGARVAPVAPTTLADRGYLEVIL